MRPASNLEYTFQGLTRGCRRLGLRCARWRLNHPVGRTHPQKGNHGNTYWKVLDLWKNDSNVALWRYNWRRNLSYRMFRVQRKRLPTKRTVDRLMAMGRWLDICDWFDYWYVLCYSRFRRHLTPGRWAARIRSAARSVSRRPWCKRATGSGPLSSRGGRTHLSWNV